MSFIDVACCAAYCGTCPALVDGACRGCRLGYDVGARDIENARCRIKVCCIKRLRMGGTCADCPDCLTCDILQEWYSKTGYKYGRYRQSFEFIRDHGYGPFLEAAQSWKGAYGKLPMTFNEEAPEGTDMNASKINREWHLSHKMPKNPTLEQRLQWHQEHAKNCPCRPITGKIAEEMKKRGMPIPKYQA